MDASQDRWAEIESLLDQVLDTDPGARAELLAGIRSHDPELAELVERLLGAITGNEQFLQEPAPAYAGPLVKLMIEEDDLAPGTKLGIYEITRELGRGGMATVYLAHDLKLDRTVAVKVLRPELGATLRTERFLREIAIAARLNHPHILALHDSGEVSGHLYYAMPYVQGESLRDRLEREGQLTIPDVLAILRPVANALSYAHQQHIVHRDIKPENILLAKSSETGSVHPLVADFGIAWAVDLAGGELLTEPGLALGTPAYMSPEQAAGGRLDGRSDLYALGCVAYEMLAGVPPFTGPTPQSILARHAVDPVPPMHTVRPTVPRPLERAIERALSKVPADRFSTADEFAEAMVMEPGPGIAAGPRFSARRLFFGVAAILVAAAGILISRSAATPALVPSASRMAILPFVSPDGDTALARLGKDLATTISASLDGVGGIETADRLSISARTARRNGLSVPEGAALVRRLGASSLVHGTLVAVGDQVRLDLGVYDTGNLAPLIRGITVTGHRDSVRALTDSITWRLLRQLWRRGTPPSPSLAAVTTGSLPALRAFLEGERELEKDNWDAAGLAYRSAIAADPSFWLAYFQDALTQYWQHRPAESQEIEMLRKHRDAFPEREQLLVDAFVSNLDPAGPSIERYRRVTQRYPDYWPGWFLYGDILYHGGPTTDQAGAVQAFRRVTQLNPNLVPAWEHLLELTAGSDPAEASRAYARMADLGGVPSVYTRLIARVNEAGGVISPDSYALADSMAAMLGSPGGSEILLQTGNTGVGLLRYGFPAAQIDLDDRVLRSSSTARDMAIALRSSRAWSWATRGQWDSALTLLTAVAREHPGVIGPMRYEDPPVGGPALGIESYALAVLGAWLGATSAESADQRRPLAVLVIGTLPDEQSRRDARARLAWWDGLLGLTRGNPTAIQVARREAVRSGYIQAELVERSLAAFEHAVRADRHRAGRELADLEESCLKEPDCNQFTPPVAVQRLVAAQWLMGAGQAGDAVRLLRRHVPSVWSDVRWTTTHAVTGPVYLARARAEEVRGEVQLARDDYLRFLRIYDRPMASQLAMVNEAKAALTRLQPTQ